MCDNPRPETGGEKCKGPDEDYISCAENGCQGKFCTDAYNYNNIYSKGVQSRKNCQQ